jgi:hypothetical protein
MDNETERPTSDIDWLSIPEPERHDPPRGERRRGPAAAAKTLVLVVVGVLAGGGIAYAAGHHSAGDESAGIVQAPAGAPGAGPVGRAGEQHITGTLTAVGSSSVTVKTPAGTATYTVDAATQIVRDGASATLSQLRVGDAVFLHVYPTSSGGRLHVERIFAGQLPSGGFGGPGGFGHDGDRDGRAGDGPGATTDT